VVDQFWSCSVHAQEASLLWSCGPEGSALRRASTSVIGWTQAAEAMKIDDAIPHQRGVGREPRQKDSAGFRALYLITFITSIGALALFQPVLGDPQSYIAGAGADNRIYFGALLELFLIISNIGPPAADPCLGTSDHRR
jgi:hypothetical protein